MQIAFPFHIDRNGLVAGTGYRAHIRDMIEQVLFTMPGERVNRPTFGCGLTQYVFASGGDEMAAATQFLVQGALQQWLGDLIQVEGVHITWEETQLRVLVQYVLRDGGSRHVEQFTHNG